jgi:hypothetical protein
MSSVIELNNENINQLDELLEIAATDSVEAAIIAKGDIINAREGIALSRLSKEELVALNEINKKIRQVAAGPGGGALATAWACGAIC